MARLRSASTRRPFCALLLCNMLLLSFSGCGGSGSSGGGGGGNPPATPSGVTATAGNQQVSLAWNAVTTASTYNVKRATTSGGPYTTISSPTTTSYTDTVVTNSTTYYYVVSAVNAYGESGNSSQASATPLAAGTSVQVTIDVLANRHSISPYVYGGSYPESAAAITDSGLGVVRWGGNGTSTYNWVLKTNNADNDWYFEDFNTNALGSAADGDSVQFVKDVKAAGSQALTTMAMLPWVAREAETSIQQGGVSNNYHWSYSVAKYGAQCGSDQYNNDAGNGLKTDCVTRLTADPTDAYYPLLNTHSDPCAGGTCVYRSDWAAALAAAFGSNGTCRIPYSPISSCHFYDMDNEIDIWGGTHVDIHPLNSGYGELRDTYLAAARLLKGWDPAAVRLGPVSCCWYFYWNLNSTTDNKAAHAGIDFLPWWLNEVAWSDAVNGSRSLDMFDIHAYPDADTNGLSQAQKQALAVKIYRDWWDPTFNSAASWVVNGGFSNEPLDGKPFRIPRMRAIVNQAYPGTTFAMTEWSAEFAGGADFSTALGDADAYGVLGRERVSLASRWTAPAAANPNYQALKLYTNYDRAHHGFGTTSVSATHNGDPNLFSTYAALNASGTALTIMVLNKDPANSAQVTFATNGFVPTNVTSYTLSQTSPTTIAAGTSQAWSATQTFAPYTATLLVVGGSMATSPAAEWDLNPDTVMVPASGTVTLNPTIASGSGNVTLASAMFDAYEGATACSGALNITTAAITTTTNGAIAVTAGSTPGFCHFTVAATDSAGVTQTQGGWIVVGKPAATLAKTSGDGQIGSKGSQLPTALTVTLTPGQSGGTATGASVLFTASAGSLSDGTNSGGKLIVVTNSSGVTPAVTLMLPPTAGPVTVTAEGPFGLGHPAVIFAETAQ